MTAVQADGLSGLSVVGECCEILERGPVKMTFEAIVVEGLSVPALGGMNFILDNANNDTIDDTINDIIDNLENLDSSGFFMMTLSFFLFLVF